MTQIVQKPVPRGRLVGLAWGCLGTGVGGGFLLGAALGGWVGGRIITALIGGIIMPLAAAGFAMQMGERARIGVLPRLALVLGSVSSGFLIGWAARAGKDLRYSAQIEAWFAETTAKVGIGLLALSVVMAIVLSFRRTGPQGTPLPPPPR